MGGEIQFGTKADLLECLEVEKFQMTYADKVFLPYVFQQLLTAQRVDID